MIDLHNDEYEKMLLGCLMHSPDSMGKNGIQESLFFRARNKKIYSLMVEQYAQEGRLDIIKLAKESGEAAEVAEMHGVVGSLEYYAKELRELYNKRALSSMARDCLSGLEDKSKTSEEIIGDLETDLLNIDLARDKGYLKITKVIPDVINEIERTIGGGGREGVVMTGLESLDRLIDGMRPEEYIIIAARPGTGKTSIALNMTLSALQERKKVGIFSAEMSRSLITKRMLCSLAGINGQKVRSGLLTRTDIEKLMEAAQTMYAGELFINDSPNIPIGVLISEARRMKRKENVDIIFVDYMSLITLSSDLPRHEQVAELSRRFKQLSRELNIPLVVISQLNREAQDKRPTMANLRESGCLARDTLILHQKGMCNIGELDGDEGFMIPSVRRKGMMVAKKCFYSGQKDLYEIELSTGHKIKATGNHKFIIPGGFWVELKELENGSLIGIPINFGNKPGEKDEITERQAKILALFIGNGCAVKRRVLQYTSNLQDSDLCDELQRCVSDEFEGAVLSSRKNQLFKHDGKIDSNAINVYFKAKRKVSRKYRNPLVLFLESVGLYDKRAKDKEIPSCIFNSSEKIKKIFIRYLWATDGTVTYKERLGRKTATISYSTSSKKLAIGLQLLLQSIGIISHIIELRKGKSMWFNIYISSKHFKQKFIGEIGIAGKRKGGSLNFCAEKIKTIVSGWTKYEIDEANNIVYVPVKSIIPAGSGPVYDIEVPEEHAFIANGFYVHNSVEQDADIIMLMWNRGWSEENPQMVKVTMIVEKNRNGAVGDVDLMFKPDITRFYPVNHKNIS